jgi:hypothetical protein
MVLGFILMPISTKTITYFLGIVLLGANASALAKVAPAKSQTHIFGDHSLTLNNDSAECELVIESDNKKTRLALPLDSMCYWATKPDSNEVQYFSYPTENISHAFLIAGTALDWDTEKKEHNKLPLNTYCSQYLQGITIKDGTVIVSGEKMDAPNCAGQTIDEKVFKGVALQKESMETNDLTTDTKEGFFDSIKKTFNQLFTSEKKTTTSD